MRGKNNRSETASSEKASKKTASTKTVSTKTVSPIETQHAASLRAGRVVLKALFLFLVLNILFFAWDPSAALGGLSLYNLVFPGRSRLPYGDNPQRAYNLSLYNLEAMFTSHQLAAREKPSDEFRVLLVGDSSTWGFLLPADQTLDAYLNQANLVTPDLRRVRVYNLGYPVMSLTKDLLMLSYGMRYQPDLVIWLFTLESFPAGKQLFPPLLQNNPQSVRSLIQDYGLSLDPNDPALIQPSPWERTLIGQRRNLADLLWLQIYGVMWAGTGIDQDIPETYTPRQEDFDEDLSFHDLQPPVLHEDDLAFDVLQAGARMVGDVPLLMVNEPMFISQGENSDLRYNFFYPRWAYDDYRRMMQEKSAGQDWYYLDLWDRVDSAEFTNSAVHMTPEGTAQLAQILAAAIQKFTSGLASDFQTRYQRHGSAPIFNEIGITDFIR